MGGTPSTPVCSDVDDEGHSGSCKGKTCFFLPKIPLPAGTPLLWTPSSSEVELSFCLENDNEQLHSNTDHLQKLQRRKRRRSNSPEEQISTSDRLGNELHWNDFSGSVSSKGVNRPLSSSLSCLSLPSISTENWGEGPSSFHRCRSEQSLLISKSQLLQPHPEQHWHTDDARFPASDSSLGTDEVRDPTVCVTHDDKEEEEQTDWIPRQRSNTPLCAATSRSSPTGTSAAPHTPLRQRCGSNRNLDPIPKSPISVFDHPTISLQEHKKETVLNTMKTASSSSSSSAFSSSSALLKEYRQAIEYHKLHSRHDKIGLARLYHSIAQLHYQESKYPAAMTVLNYVLEDLVLPTLSPDPDATLCGMTTSLDDCWSILFEQEPQAKYTGASFLMIELILTRSKIILSSRRENEIDDNADTTWIKTHVKNAVKFLQLQGQKDDNANHGLLIAECTLTLAQAYHAQQSAPKAINHYQHALHLARTYLKNDNHVKVAKIVFKIGDWHLDHGDEDCRNYDWALQCYKEALRIYQTHYYHYQHFKSPVRADNSVEKEAKAKMNLLLIDIATTLSRIGWIQLEQKGDPAAGLQTTQQALALLLQQNYQQNEDRHPQQSHRNIVSIRYQLGMAHLRLGQPEVALKIWKQVLQDQEILLQPSKFLRTRQNVCHADILKTLEGIAMAYQDCSNWEKAHAFLRGSLEYATANNINSGATASRLLVRMSIGWMARNNMKRAKRSLTKAWKYYDQNKNLVPDDFAIQTMKRFEEACIQ